MILENLSKRIAEAIKRSDPEGKVSVEVMEYALGIKLNLIATILLTIALGVVTGHMKDALIALTAFAVVRRFSGGIHMKSLTWCAVVSALLFTVIPLVDMNERQVLIVSVLTIIIFLFFSPCDLEGLNPSKIDPYLKLISVSIAATNIVIGSSVIGMAFFAQAILILPWEGGVQLWRKR